MGDVFSAALRKSRFWNDQKSAKDIGCHRIFYEASRLNQNGKIIPFFYLQQCIWVGHLVHKFWEETISGEKIRGIDLADFRWKLKSNLAVCLYSGLPRSIHLQIESDGIQRSIDHQGQRQTLALHIDFVAKKIAHDHFKVDYQDVLVSDSHPLNPGHLAEKTSMSEEKQAHHNGVPTQLTTVTLTAEQFESLYLQPRSSAGRNALVGNLGNPTPIGVTSFLVSLLPLSMDLMGFQGASSASGITMLGAFYGIGGIGLYISSLMEWILGNTFPSVVFAAFGGFWISYAIILQPSFDIAASFATADQATNSATAAAAGSATTAYNSGLALYFLTWGLLTFVLFIASLRTNVPFAGMLFFITFAFELLAAAYFHIGHGNASQASDELKAAGAFGFVVAILGIWIDVSLLFASVGFPIRIPVIDLSKWGRKENGGEQV